VHLELNLARLPNFYTLLKAAAPDDISIRALEASDLAGEWLHDEIATRTLGEEGLAAKATALCRVPSAIVPATFNVLLNPEHQEAARVLVLREEQYPWDARFLAERCAESEVCRLAPEAWGPGSNSDAFPSLSPHPFLFHISLTPLA
jgi:hypothetical protein